MNRTYPAPLPTLRVGQIGVVNRHGILPLDAVISELAIAFIQAYGAFLPLNEVLEEIPGDELARDKIDQAVVRSALRLRRTAPIVAPLAVSVPFLKKRMQPYGNSPQHGRKSGKVVGELGDLVLGTCDELLAGGHLRVRGGRKGGSGGGGGESEDEGERETHVEDTKNMNE